MERKIIACSGSMMTKGIADFGMEHLDAAHFDHFQMHPWQAMQILEFATVENLNDTIEPGKPGWSFLKIRVVEDPHFPEDVIELRDKDENVLIQFRNVGSLKHEHR